MPGLEPFCAAIARARRRAEEAERAAVAARVSNRSDVGASSRPRATKGIDASDDARPTPCEGLDVAALRTHVMQALTTFVRGLEHPQGRGGGGPITVNGRGGDQVRDLARRIAAKHGSEPELLFLGGPGLTADIAYPLMLDEFLAHAWDLAVATGQPFAPRRPDL